MRSLPQLLALRDDACLRPRLRERHRLELSFADDARGRTRPREVERYCAIARRIEQLLSDLGEEVE